MALPEAGFLLAYVEPGGELHATFYDGSSDTKIADGVAAVWSLNLQNRSILVEIDAQTISSASPVSPDMKT